MATANWAGSSTIRAASGAVGCSACANLSITAPPGDLSLDVPTIGSPIASPFLVGGWAINRSAPFGSGVDAVHVYAWPAAGGAAIFLGVATLGGARPDVAAAYGAQFLNSGFNLVAGSLNPGPYVIAVYTRNAQTATFDVVRTAAVSVVLSQPFISVDTPAPNSTQTSAFEVGGWAADRGSPPAPASTRSQFYIFPNEAARPACSSAAAATAWRGPTSAGSSDRASPTPATTTRSPASARAPTCSASTPTAR